MNEAKKKKIERLRGQNYNNGSMPIAHGLAPGSFPVTPSSKPIGIYLQRIETGETHCASDRIRGIWPMSNSSTMELFNPNKNYETVIFHIPCPAIARYGKIKILDICDNVWKKDMQKFKQMIEPIHAIIVPTEELKDELKAITDKDIHVVEDGHDFSHYSKRLPNLHTDRAKEVVWFGYSQNAECLTPFVNYIKSLGLKLKVISQDQNTYPLALADVFVKWDVNTYIQEISKSDFAILPPNKHYKSNNKEITALLSGIPVATTKEDISRLMIPAERQAQMHARQTDLPKYNVKGKVAQYEAIIQDLKKTDPIEVYSAICGKFDKPRQDITIFTDSNSDKFRLPVMNAKIYKVLAHKYVDSALSVYMDGNIFLNVTPSKLCMELLKGADIAIFKHPWRNCLYQEFEHAKARVLPQYQPLMDEQVARYRKEGMPVNFGLAECGMIIRRHNTATEEFNERWWAEICRYTNRDQMSFPYVLWKMKDRIKVNFIPGNVREHAFFKYVPH